MTNEQRIKVNSITQIGTLLIGFGSMIYGGVTAYNGLIDEIRKGTYQYQYVQKDLDDIHVQMGRVDIPQLAKQVEANSTMLQKHETYFNYLTNKPMNRSHDNYAFLK